MGIKTGKSKTSDIHKINFLKNHGFILIAACLLFVTSPCAFPNDAAAADIGGTVRDAGGTAIIGVEVEVRILVGNPCGGLYHVQSTWTDALDGAYSFTGLATGQYYLKTNNMNVSDYVNEWWASGASSTNCGDAEALTLDAAGASGIDFQLDAGVTVSGMVYQSDGVTPLTDATINLDIYQSADPCWGQQWKGHTSTEADGSFTIRGLIQGDYYLKTDNMNQSDYIDEWLTNGNSATECSSAEILTVGATGVTGVDFQLDTGVEVSGTVFESDGTTAIVGVSIQVELIQGAPCGRWYHVRTAHTDSSDGTYTLMGIKPGAYYLKTHHMHQSNYIDKWWASGESVYDCNDAEALSVGAGGATEIDFQLEQGVEISGTVYQDDGTTPVTGVRINVSAIQGDPCGSHQGWGGQHTDPADGTYTIRGLPTGQYYLMADNLNESNYIDEWWSSSFDATGCGDAESLDLTAGGSSGVDFELDLGVEISGTVYQSNGTTPVTGAEIHVRAIQGDPCNYQQHVEGVNTNSTDGTYRIMGFPLGTFYLQTDNMNRSNYINEWWSSTFDAVDCDDAESINLTTGGQSGVDFQLDIGVEISGTVYQSDGVTPVTGVPIDVQVLQGDPCGWHHWKGGQWTNTEDGTYVIKGLPAGEYYVRTNNMNQSNYINEWWSSGSGSYDCSGAESVNITTGAQSGIDFQLDLGAEISGTIYESDGITPVTGERMQVNVVSGDPCEDWNHVTSAETDPTKGTFIVRGLPLETYYLQTHNLNQSNYVDAWWTNEGRTYDCAEAGSISLGSGGQSGVDFQLDLGVEISGTVYQSDGTTLITGIPVGLEALQGDPCGNSNYVRGTDTDPSDGTYSLMGLLPGEYFLRTNNRNHSDYVNEWWAGGSNSSFNCGDAVPITVNGGGQGGVNFSLALGGSISGTVSGADGGLGDAWVEAFTGHCWDGYAGGNNTDQDGNYHIRGLPARDVFVHVWPGEVNYFEQWYDGSLGTRDCSSAMPVTITSGSDEPIDFTLEAGFTIQPSVMNVRQPDGSFQTYVEVGIGGDFIGSLPGDIDAITIKAPDETVVASYPAGNLSFLSQWDTFFVALNGSPMLGLYTFTVTSGDATVTETDHQYVLRTFPLHDTTTFSPSTGSTINSKTPSFSWGPINYEAEDIAIYYRFEIWDEIIENRVYATGRIFNRYYHTVPEGILVPGTTYNWRVRVLDNNEWEYVENRVNSEWMTFTVANGFAPHNSMPAIYPDNWMAATYITSESSRLLCWLRVIDHDGVASDGSSHQVTVRFPDGSTHAMHYDRTDAHNMVAYYMWYNDTPLSGPYTFTVTDPDGNVGTWVDEFANNPLDIPDENTLTPSNKNPDIENITATYDNVYVNGVLYDDFEAYGSIEDLDFAKWRSWYSNASIVSGQLQLRIEDVVGRGHGSLSFTNPETINSIKADITVNSISDLDGPPRAEIRGAWANNGIGEIWGGITVKGNRVYYGLSEDYLIDRDKNYTWNELASGDLMNGISPGQTITVEVAISGNTMTFSADGNTASYTIPGTIYPPREFNNSKSLRTRINLVTDTTPTFTWAPVAGANRYEIRIYNWDRSRRPAQAWPGDVTSYTFPPGILPPNGYFNYRFQARDAPSPLDFDNVSKTPAYDNDNYRFYTNGQEAVDPFIDLDAHGALVWNNELMEPYLAFTVLVYDLQGVPGNIASVTVEHPTGEIEELEYRPDFRFTPPTPTSGYYFLQSAYEYNPDQTETYIFTVTDTEGHSFTISEDLSPDPIGYPAESSLSPSNNAVVGSTAVDFNWQDVPDVLAGEGFFRLEIWDHNFNRIYMFYTTESSYHLPAGLLEEKTFYRWRITTRREYFSDNVDNGSSSPASFYDMRTFVTTSLTDSDTDNLPDDWELSHWSKLNANDGQGDADGDGLSNEDEYLKGTDPNNSDTDNDGIPDGADSFPLSAGESADSDGDGTPDNTDACPYDPNDDSDSDGVCGDIDNCPGDPNGDQVDLDGNEWGDVCDDIDGDLANDNVDPWPIDPDNDIDGDGYGADPFENCLNIDPNLTELAAICQAVDNCPGIANDQTDSDDDGIGDACDLAVGGAPPACHPVKNPCDPPIDDTAAEDDADGDAIPDAEDLCPNLHIDDDPNDSVEDPLTGSINHLNTDGDGDGDACDNDDDNDGVADASDNCPLVHNTGQNNLDCDNQGDLCDPDRDGDGYTDSDEISTYGTLPDNADTDGDGWSDGDQIPIDCNNIYDPQITQANDPAPLGEPPQYSISIEVLNLAGADIRSTWLPTPEWNEGLAEWMPENIRIRATLQDENGNATPLNGDMTFEILDSTNHEGVAANDEEENSGEPLGDFSFNPTVSGDITDTLQTINTNGETEIELDLHVFDFGGRATVKVSTSTQDGDLVVGQIKIPLDSDSDNLPDRWEQMHGFDPFNANSYSVEKIDGDADIDVSANNSHKGDGLPNFREYRGIILDVVNANGKIHQRLDPLKKDLFVRGDNFFNSIPSNTSPGVLPFSVDHTGIYGIPSAFEEAGIVVHDVTGMPSFVDEADSLWEPPHIDVLVVTNKTQPRDDGLIDTLTGLENGFINHPSSLIPRYWTWDLKGASYIGNVQFYAIFHDEATGVTKRGTETYHLTLMHYFHNRPYWEDSNNASLCNEGYLNMLDPLHNVEDYYKENGIDPPDSKGKNKEDRCVAENGVLDGDRMIPTWKTELWGIDNYEAGFQYSTFDADGDGRVENPIFDDAEFLDPNEWDAGEYTATQVQLHTILHEMGHAVGMDEQHTSDPEDLMFEESINWSRAGHFSPYSQSQILIHNKTELQ